MRKFANNSGLQPSNLNVQNLIPSVMQHILCRRAFNRQHFIQTYGDTKTWQVKPPSVAPKSEN